MPDWSEIGTKQSLVGTLAGVTGIRQSVLESSMDINRVLVAERMRRVANRKTASEEDIAYCLMGIFGVNMPLLYGEGGRPFIQLQNEILRILDDYTLLAWSWASDHPSSSELPSSRTGLRPCAMSTHPRAFERVEVLSRPMGPLHYLGPKVKLVHRPSAEPAVRYSPLTGHRSRRPGPDGGRQGHSLSSAPPPGCFGEVEYWDPDASQPAVSWRHCSPAWYPKTSSRGRSWSWPGRFARYRPSQRSQEAALAAWSESHYYISSTSLWAPAVKKGTRPRSGPPRVLGNQLRLAERTRNI